MLDDTLAFALMADRAARWSRTIPLEVKLAYLLPYATYHESRQNWRPLLFAKFFALVADAPDVRTAISRSAEIYPRYTRDIPEIRSRYGQRGRTSRRHLGEISAASRQARRAERLHQLDGALLERLAAPADGRRVHSRLGVVDGAARDRADGFRRVGVREIAPRSRRDRAEIAP